MSLNTVVNNLVRAAAGIPADIADADLDRHVAQLLAAEAKAKEKSWSEMGLSAFLHERCVGVEAPLIVHSPDTNLPKTNKRFLASVIRNVDGHNSALLKAQAESARDARGERRGESSRSGASRLFGGALQGMRSDHRGRGARSERRSERGERRGSERGERRRERSEDRQRSRDNSTDGHRSHRKREETERARSRSPEPPPASKMDKYFKRDYNPRLDYGEVPKEGLVAEVGWDNMLAVLKEKGKKVRKKVCIADTKETTAVSNAL